MDNKKFEQLIDLIINENEEQARALFHDIVVEKSREIYESIMDEEFGQDQVGGLVDEISAEEEGMTEEEDEFADIGADEGDEEVSLDADDIGGEETGEEDLEDRVVDLEDKLDELMAEFESIMSGDEGGSDMGGEEEFGGDMGGDDMSGDEMMEGEEEDLEESEDDEEETLEEAVQLQKVSVTHGDNGQNTKSIVSSGPKVGGNGASAANLNKGYVDSGKGGTQGGLLNPATKDLKGAGTFKNAPGKFKFSEKGEAAPKAKHGDDGVNTKSIVGESRKTVKKIVK
jgi:hypothetical protein